MSIEYKTTPRKMASLDNVDGNVQRAISASLFQLSSSDVINSINAKVQSSITSKSVSLQKPITLDLIVNSVQSASIDSQINTELRSISDLTSTHFTLDEKTQAFVPNRIAFGVESSVPAGSGAVIRIDQVNECGSILSVKVLNGGQNYVSPIISVIRDDRSLTFLQRYAEDTLKITSNDINALGGVKEAIKLIQIDQTTTKLSDVTNQYMSRLLEAMAKGDTDAVKEIKMCYQRQIDESYKKALSTQENVIPSISNVEGLGLVTAILTPTIVDGVITNIVITNPGSGYTYHDIVKIIDTSYMKVVKVPTLAMSKQSNIGVQQYDAQVNVKYGDVTADPKGTLRIGSTIDNTVTNNRNISMKFVAVPPTEAVSRLLDIFNSSI